MADGEYLGEPWIQIKGTIYDLNTGEPLTNETVKLYFRLKGDSQWHGPATVDTNSRGIFRYDLTAPPDDAEVKVVHPQDDNVYEIVDIYVPDELKRRYTKVAVTR